MQTVVLIIHLLLALSLMAVVLLQRSEGGGLGIGGGAMGPQAGRPPMTGLAKLTWGFAAAFICTSLALTVIAASNSSETSVLERIGLPAPQAPATPDIQLPDLQLPPVPNAPLLPPVGTDAGAVPTTTEAPAAPSATEAPATPSATEAPAQPAAAPEPTAAPAATPEPSAAPSGN